MYLVPEPDTPFRRLTEEIADRWPESPPFGGRFDELVPHLTIAQGQDDAVLEEAEAGLRGRLPVTARVSSVDLMVHDKRGGSSERRSRWGEGSVGHRSAAAVGAPHRVRPWSGPVRGAGLSLTSTGGGVAGASCPTSGSPAGPQARYRGSRVRLLTFLSGKRDPFFPDRKVRGLWWTTSLRSRHVPPLTRPSALGSEWLRKSVCPAVTGGPWRRAGSCWVC
ncbi:2'-5' RNA ligase family protein [Streptomyces sp. NPDC088358]|uniref:2'-5' RNA ligase family protein n=1 Tax=Streptomyces sp. NPDC088358 TaxID=3365857 RepID=UPI0037F74148